jgi:hypothetical protein
LPFNRKLITRRIALSTAPRADSRKESSRDRLFLS